MATLKPKRMKIVTRYIAEDGRTFEDPLECQDYEDREMGIIPGSVASLIQSLKKLPQDNFCTCIFYIRGKSGKNIYPAVTIDLEPYLSPYVNVADLEEDKRCITCTIGQLIKTLGQYDKESPVCGMMIYADNFPFRKNVSVFQSVNPKCWEKK